MLLTWYSARLPSYVPRNEIGTAAPGTQRLPAGTSVRSVPPATAAGLASGTAADTTTASRVNAESGTSGVSCAPPPGTGVQAVIVAWYSASPISTCETTGAVEGVSRKSCDAASPPLTSARFV